MSTAAGSWATPDAYAKSLRWRKPPVYQTLVADETRLRAALVAEGYSPEIVEEQVLISRALNKEVGGWVPPCLLAGFPVEFQGVSPYLLARPRSDDDTPDGCVPPEPADVLGLDDHERRPCGTVVAPMAFGDSRHVLRTEFRSDGSKRYQDVALGPGLSMGQADFNRRAFPDYQDPDAKLVYSVAVERTYFDEDDRRIARLLLNRGMRPQTHWDVIPILVLFNPNSGFPRRSWAWAANGQAMQDDTFACVTYDEHDGRKLRVEQDDGVAQLFRGVRGEERMVMQSMSAYNQALQRQKGVGENGAVVSEQYTGPINRPYIARRTYEDGTVDFFQGTEPQDVSITRRWHPDGRMVHYVGDQGSEVPTHSTFEPRTHDQKPCDVAVDAPHDEWPMDLAFLPRDQVRPVGLYRQDINGRAGVVVGFKTETGRYQVSFGEVHPVCDGDSVDSVCRGLSAHGDEVAVCFFSSVVNGRTVALASEPVSVVNIKPANLVSEEAYKQDKAARDARRSAKSQARADRRAAERLAKQELATAELSAALQAARIKPERQRVPVAPACAKASPRVMARCPISGVPMDQAVLAGDGYAYQHQALMAFWEKIDGFVSPITGACICAATFPHMPLRSLAKEINVAPSDPKWDRVPKALPSVLECSITHDVMEDPVLACDGQCYERSAIEQWLGAGRETSPLTNAPMGTHLRTDLTMRAMCSAWA